MRHERTGVGRALRVHDAPQGLLSRALAGRRRVPSGGWARAWALAGAALAVGFAVGRVSTPGPTAPLDVASAPSAIPVRLVCVRQGAGAAAVAGSWNGWDPAATPMVEVADGVFATTVLLERGRHEYMFVVDGGTWTTDLAATTWNDDGFGNRNAVIEL